MVHRILFKLIHFILYLLTLKFHVYLINTKYVPCTINLICAVYCGVCRGGVFFFVYSFLDGNSRLQNRNGWYMVHTYRYLEVGMEGMYR